MKITVVIPTLNEENDLPKTLESIKNIADEILIIDSGSNDKTINIANNFGAKILFHKFISFSDTRNFGNENAKGDWILSIEADVIISKELAKEIRQQIEENKYAAFYISRLNIIWGKPIYHTDWGPKDDTHVWLYKRGSGLWKGLVHEEYFTDQPIGKIKNYLFHNNYENISEFIDKINKYSDLAIKQKRFISKWWFLRDFFKRYIYKQGYLDGYHGLFLSYLQSVYYLTLTIKKHQ